MALEILHVDLPEIANWQWTGSTSAATSSER